MRHRINNLCVLGSILFYFYSCGQASQGSKEADPTTSTRKDTAKRDTGAMMQSFVQAADTVFPKNFLELKDAFVNDSAGRHTPNRNIRPALLASYLKHDLDTSYPKTFNPLQMIQNKSGWFFIVRENCVSGGDCAYYWLLLFRKNGQIVRHQKLGQLAAEEDEVIRFSYVVIGDSALVTKEIDNQIEKGRVDSTMKRIRLTL
jgi:hypothetical protein